MFSGCFFYYEHLRLQRKEQTRENVGDASKVGCFQMRVIDLRRRHRLLRTTPPRSAGNRFVHPLECSCPTLCSRQRRLGLTRSSDATGGSKVNRGSSGHLRQPAANPPRQRCSAFSQKKQHPEDAHQEAEGEATTIITQKRTNAAKGSRKQVGGRH